jgi:phospholipase D1/2
MAIGNNDKLKNIKFVRNFYETCDIKSIGSKKFKETYIKKRSGGRHKAPNCWKRIVSCCNQWNKRYLIVTSEGVMVAKFEFGSKAKVREMLLFDYNFKLEYGKSKTGYTRGILIRTTTRNLFLQSYDDESFIDLIVALLEAYQSSSATALHRFDSFAPIR